MKSLLIRPLRAAFMAATVLAAIPASAADTTLIVNLAQVKPGPGPLRVGLYRDPATFRKEDKALAVVSGAATGDHVELRFPGLAPGRYAIMAYHDENSDGTLNRRFGMFPTEGYGLSNNPKVSGPPAFADSAFEVSGTETRISIDLHY
jgi:uncharacterized protein (DUF2141 family)